MFSRIAKESLEFAVLRRTAWKPDANDARMDRMADDPRMTYGQPTRYASVVDRSDAAAGLRADGANPFMPKRQVLSIRRFVVGTLVLICLGINASGVYYLSLEHKLVEETILAAAMEHAHSWARRLATELSDGRTAAAQETIDAIAGAESV